MKKTLLLILATLVLSGCSTQPDEELGDIKAYEFSEYNLVCFADTYALDCEPLNP